MALTTSDKKWITECTQKIANETIETAINGAIAQVAKLFKNYVDFEIQQIKEKVDQLPSREELFSLKDVLTSKYAKVDMEHDFLSLPVKEHEMHTGKLEKRKI